MKKQEIKFKSKDHNYSIIIGENTLNILPRKIRLLCSKTKNIALIIAITVFNKNKLKKNSKKKQNRH